MTGRSSETLSLSIARERTVRTLGEALSTKSSATSAKASAAGLGLRSGYSR